MTQLFQKKKLFELLHSNMWCLVTSMKPFRQKERWTENSFIGGVVIKESVKSQSILGHFRGNL